MKIAFVSVRGIPNNYGGFEQFAEYVSVGLAARGHEVTVYSPSYHPYKEEWYKGVRIKHIYSPEPWMGGSAGSFVYDFLSLRDALKREHYDIIYEAGYTSIIPAFIWFDVRKVKGPFVVTNMDGLEYKRTKFGPLVRRFIHWEEKMAVRHSHYLIADNMGIHDYYKKRYGRESKFLAYGADIHDDFEEGLLSEWGLKPYGYYLLVARLEPENNVSMAIDGYRSSKEYGCRPLIIVGKTTTPYARDLIARYAGDDNIRFVGGIYDFRKLDSVRHYSFAYFHGHSVGGTNPSLLEAMASGCLILSHDNVFNRTVLKEGALYYNSPAEAAAALDRVETLSSDKRTGLIAQNIEEIKVNYSWKHLVDLHEEFFMSLLAKR